LQAIDCTTKGFRDGESPLIARSPGRQDGRGFAGPCEGCPDRAPIAWIIELIEAIPFIGRLIDEIWNVIQEVWWRYVGLFDAFLGLIGIRPLKKMHICIVILKDENGVPTSSQAVLQPAIDQAVQIFRDEANIHLTVEGIHTVDDPSPTGALDPGCNADAWGEDLSLVGSYFQATAAWHCPLGSTGRIIGYRPEIVVFCVRQIPGATAGCALGPLDDYLTIEGANPVCLAHELSHKVGLWHCCDTGDLANPACGGTRLDWWQVLIARNSKYVTYI
jgi:hypothetical protein